MAKAEAKVKKEVKKEVKTVTAKKKKKVAPNTVKIRISASYNNTIVSVTDYDGNVIVNSSCGGIGFKGTRKSTAYASTKAGEDAATKVKELGAHEAEVIVKGIGVGRQAAVKGIRQGGLRIISLADHTPIAHGGCKARRQPKK